MTSVADSAREAETVLTMEVKKDPAATVIKGWETRLEIILPAMATQSSDARELIGLARTTNATTMNRMVRCRPEMSMIVAGPGGVAAGSSARK